MKKSILSFFMLASMTLSAQTQPGLVRTVSRPNNPSEKLSGVMLRVRGNHNAVMSAEDGAFALLMQGLEPGQPYAISSVIKSGYQLREPEMIGRKQSFSTSVPLEIVMISTQVLMQEQARIEEKARANVEANYIKRLAELDEALAAAKMSNADYEAKMTALEEQYERFEPMLQTMSRYYALTDYDAQDSIANRINERIEAGDLDEAERLIKAKGSVSEREKKVKELEKMHAYLRDDLAKDCYHLFTIHLERFENDSAEYYICRRAELDTTNVEYQLRAGQFLMIYRAEYDPAEMYFRRALRQAEKQYGAESGDVATALSEIGECYYRRGNYNEALNYLKRSAALSEQLRGKQSPAMAQSYSNLGALYLRMGKNKEALSNMREALKIYEAVCPPTDPLVPQAQNNLGNALFGMQKYDEAKEYLEKALAGNIAYYGETHFEVAIAYNNLASIAFVQGHMADAEQLFEKAVAIFTRTLGDHHPRTQQAKRNLEHLRGLNAKK